MNDIDESPSHLFSSPSSGVGRHRPIIRRFRSVSLPQFEVHVVDVDNNQIKQIGLSLPNLPKSTFLGSPQGREEEQTEQIEHPPPFSAVLSSDFFLDECPALLSQMPDSFDLGRTRVRLNSIAASARHIAIGSECGALFLFNRRIGRSVKPLRTDHNEVISAIEFCTYGRDGCELLAVGHRSGKLVILSLPCADASNPKLLQHVQDEAHRHSAVQCLCWSNDGRMLFSGDELGMVLVTHVDFANAQFPVGVVDTETANGSPIVAMFSSGPLFAFAKQQKCKVCNWQKNCETVAEVSLNRTALNKIVGIHLSSSNTGENQLSLLLSDGTICRKDLSAIVDVLSKVTSFSYDIFQGQEVRVVSLSNSDGPSWALWSQNGHIEICYLRPRGFALDTVALEGRVDQVLCICAPSSSSSDELFILSSPSIHPLQQRRRIFRLSRLSSAHPSLTACLSPPPNGHSLLFGYLYGTVEKAMDELARLKSATAGRDGTEAARILPQGTEEMLGRWNRELDVFLMGDGTAKGFDEVGAAGISDFLPEFGSVFPEGTTKIATGLHQIFGQLRQQSSNLFFTPDEENTVQNLSENVQSTEFDHLSLGETSTSRENDCQKRQRRDSSAKMSLPTEFSCSAEDEAEEEEKEFGLLLRERDSFGGDKIEQKTKVNVERKRIVLRQKRTKNGCPRMRREGKDKERELDDECEAMEQHQMDSKMAGEETGDEIAGESGWTAGAVSDERQQQIMEMLGIVPKLTPETPPTALPKSVVEISTDQRETASAEEEGPSNEGQSDEIENKETWERGEEDEHKNQEQMIALTINSATGGGYSFPSANDGQLLEDEFPPIVPSVSLVDLIALFPPPLPQSSAVFDQRQNSLSSPPSSTFSFASYSSSTASISLIHPSPFYQRFMRLSHADQWRRLDMPFTVGELTLCRHYLIACPGGKRSAKNATEEKQRPHYLMANLLENERSLDAWVPLRVNASAVAVNNEGTLLWRIFDGVAYSPRSPPDPFCPSSTLCRTMAWMEMSNQFEGDIVQMALNSQNAWFLADTGRRRKERTVWVQMFLPEMGIFHRAVDEDNRHFFAQLAVSDHAVWTLSGGMIVARVGLKLDLAPMGLDWADIDQQPRKFVSIALHQHTGLGLERTGNVWFVHGVAENSPFGHGPWFKVCFPSSDPSFVGLSHPSSEWRLRVGTPGVFIVAGSVLLHTNASLFGSHFDHVVPDRLVVNDHFTLITATGFCGLPNDCLFLCQPSSDELFSFSLRKRHFTSLPSYSSDSSAKVQCLSATPSRLFVLDKGGELYVRPVELQMEGNGGRMCRQWMKVQRPSKEESIDEVDWHHGARNVTSVKFISVFACAISIWAISEDGSIWISRRFGQSSSLADDSQLDGEMIGTDWIKIEGPPDGGKTAADQIRVSPSGSSVWLFSRCRIGCWYRAELSECNWMGSQWATSEALQNIRINELAAGDTAVWALDNDLGQLHRFYSTGWQPMDVRLNALSTDALDGRLWALDNEFRIVRHEMDVMHTLNTPYKDLEDEDNEPRQQQISSMWQTKEIRQQQKVPPIDHSPVKSARWVANFPVNFMKMFSFFR